MDEFQKRKNRADVAYKALGDGLEAIYQWASYCEEVIRTFAHRLGVEWEGPQSLETLLERIEELEKQAA